MEKIMKVSEAFSIEPIRHYVGQEILLSIKGGEERNVFATIESIELEEVQIGNNSSTCDYEMMYIGRFGNRDVAFRFIAKACNVEYY